MTKDEALRLALEALSPDPYRSEWAVEEDKCKAITTIKAALEAKDEPVAWYRDEDGIRIYYESKVWDDANPLYTTPPQRTWVGLTDEEMLDCLTPLDAEAKRLPLGFKWFAQAIEAKLKEKNI